MLPVIVINAVIIWRLRIYLFQILIVKGCQFCLSIECVCSLNQWIIAFQHDKKYLSLIEVPTNKFPLPDFVWPSTINYQLCDSKDLCLASRYTNSNTQVIDPSSYSEVALDELNCHMKKWRIEKKKALFTCRARML